MATRGKMKKGRGRGLSVSPQEQSDVPRLSEPAASAVQGRGRGLSVSPQEQPGVPRLSEPAALAVQGRGRGRGLKSQQQSDRTRFPEHAVSTEFRSHSGVIPGFPGRETSVPARSRLEMAQRPGYSRASWNRQIKLISNLFQLTCNQKCFYHYDIDIVPLDKKRKNTSEVDVKLPGKEMCNKIIFELLKVQRHLGQYMPIYDGKKNMFTSRPLPIKNGQEFEIHVPVNNREKRFSVFIKPVIKKHTNDNAIYLSALEDYVSKRSKTVPNEVRLVFDAILAYRTPNCNQVNVRNAFFFKDVRNRMPLGDGCEVWIGYNQSVHFTEKGAAVIVNVAAAAFHKSGPLLEKVCDSLRVRYIDPRRTYSPKDGARLQKSLKNIRVEVTHQKYRRKYVIQGLGKAAREQMVEITQNSGSKRMSVEEYFKLIYQIDLKYPYLPCLHMKGGKGNVFIPMEVCEIVAGQRVQGKLDGRKTAEMIKVAAIPPVKRFNQIQDNAKTISSKSALYMEKFGLKMELIPLSVIGRVLEQPTISYIEKSSCSPNDRGVWNNQNQFLESASSGSKLQWTLISFANPDVCSRRRLDFFADLLCKNGRKYGLSLSYPRIEIYGGRDKIDEIFKFFCGSSGPSCNFLVVVLSGNDFNHSYAEVKFFGEVKYGLITQCIDEKLIANERKLNDQVAANICLKLNTKLGGINHTLSEWPMALHKERVILFGADVVHAVGSKCPSIAAVVACTDYSMCKYAVSCRAQSNPKGSGRSQEIIIELKEMVITLLKAYYRSTKMKPQKILFYRDGVSEGQFQHVLEQEIPMIKDACQALEKDYQPPITFVIVQKRHQVRLRPERESDGIGRNCNVPAGTAVDTVIVNPMNYDFYLCSHEGIQGTSKPTHYTVLFDENRVKPDVMEILTFYLCHVYARCNRSISIPAPVKYADLLAYRASYYVQCQLESVVRSSSIDEEVPEDIKELVKSIDRIKSGMFFV